MMDALVDYAIPPGLSILVTRCKHLDDVDREFVYSDEDLANFWDKLITEVWWDINSLK